MVRGRPLILAQPELRGVGGDACEGSGEPERWIAVCVCVCVYVCVSGSLSVPSCMHVRVGKGRL